jgi:hypothetical protein
MKTFSQIASLVAKKEGKKSQALIGDIREILHILVELEIETLSEITYAIKARANTLQAKRAKKAPKK